MSKLVALKQDLKTLSVENKDSYLKYWETLRPKNTNQVFLAWLFSYLTIHTTWTSTVKAFTLLKDFNTWINNKEKLKELLINSRAGLHNNRTNFISHFSEYFWQNTDKFTLDPLEQRVKLLQDLQGIGIAKISFALELLYPENDSCICLDTHMLKIFDLSAEKIKNQKYKRYFDAEKEWINLSKELDTPPVILRAMYWDKLQGHSDTRYWGDCLVDAYSCT